MLTLTTKQINNLSLQLQNIIGYSPSTLKFTDFEQVEYPQGFNHLISSLIALNQFLTANDHVIIYIEPYEHNLAINTSKSWEPEDLATAIAINTPFNFKVSIILG